MNRADKRRRSDDLEGAIATLREAIETRPTALRLSNLATYLTLKEEWAEAYELYLKAGALGLKENLYRNNLASVLRSLGRPEEALTVLEPYVHSAEASFGEVCQYCNVLLDLNRTDDAWEQISRAETMFKKPASRGERWDRPSVRAMIDACRKRFEDRSGKKKSETLDEL